MALDLDTVTESRAVVPTQRPSGLRAMVQRAFRPDVRQTLNLISPWKFSTPAYPDMQYQKYVEEAYRKNELIFACIREIATSVSEARFRTGVEVEGQMRPVLDHPIQALLTSPNDEMTSDEFWEAVIVLEHIAGDSFVWKERDENTDRVKALWPLRPDWVRTVYTQADLVSYYVYAPDGATEGIPIAPEDVIHFRYGVDPLDLYGRGISPVRIAMRHTALDNEMTDYFKVFFENAAVPYGIIQVKKRIENRRVANAIRRRWQQQYSGAKGWHAPAILDEDASYQRLGLDLEQLRIDSLRNVPETRICMTFGVPPTLVGAEVGLQRSTYSNYREARGSFWDETLSPLFKKYAARMTRSLVDDFATPVQFSIYVDLSSVRALQEDQTDRWKRATAAFNAGAITRNMFLREVGLPPVDGGDVFLQKGTMIEVPAGTPVSEERTSYYTEVIKSIEAREGLLLSGPKD
jgi:HK97 family phage portal protein